MINRTTKLRWRRRFRRSRLAVEDFGLQTEEHVERHLIRRLSRLYEVRRFFLSWLLLVGVLITGLVLQVRGLSGYYQVLRPVPGGTYREGIIGAFTNANPLYAAGGVDGAVSRLLFSSLLMFDEENRLVGDLARSWKADASGLRYTVKLRPDVKWHDGEPLTADDVIFTYQTIQNPDARSPLQPSWAGIKFEQPDEHTVVFILPNRLSSFPYALTNGIVPKHILQDLPASQLRSVEFNTDKPIGSGPFKWEVIEVQGTTVETRQEQIGLRANEQYYRGAPKLERFTIRAFRNEKQLLESFAKQEINAIAGLTSRPEEIAESSDIKEFNVPLTGEIMVFFRNSHDFLRDKKVRQALVHAADTAAIIEALEHEVIPARGPLLESHLGYDPKITQLPTNKKAAERLLNEAGWRMGPDGIRVKGNQPLTFQLYAQNTGEYAQVTQLLQEQWRTVGINVEVILRPDNELQTTVVNHAYDALLYGISLGNDPDVFAYWHSSQADPRATPRLNLSEYKSSVADRALEAGRTRSDRAVRAPKYKPFLTAWRNDAPALALYQPRFLYIIRGELHGFNPQVMNNAIERYANVHNWMIRQARMNK